MSEYMLGKPDRERRPAPPVKSENGISKRLIALAVLLLIGGISFLIYLATGMPDLREIEDVNPAQVTRLYSSDGKVIHELFRFNRIWTPYEKIPEHVIQAAIATEDRRFFDHWGVNIYAIPRAVFVNLKNLSKVQGFSTITMQVARNLYEKIGFEKSFIRKLRETLTAIQIERTYSKKEIIEMYLNVVWFGNGAYGIQSAAATYFGKDVSELTVKEGALLVGILKGPSWNSPTRWPERATLRRNVALHNMVVCGFLPRAEYDQLKTEPLFDNEVGKGSSTAPYFTEHIRQQLNALQDSLDVDVYEDGLNVYTSLNFAHQAAMDSAIKRQMPELQKRVRAHLRGWQKRNSVPDSVFERKSEVQIAFIALDHRSGHITAMTGGRDFDESKFNRAIQARRQPGSTFKAFLYTAALDNGYSPSYKMLNQPIVINNPDGTRWTPENFDKKFGGPTTLREGIKNSINLIAARLILELGPQVLVDYASRMGIRSPLKPYPSLAMGSTGVKPMEMVQAFAVLANEGIAVEPVTITRIEDRLGKVIYERRPRRQEALSKTTAGMMTHMLSTAINNGTGASSRWKYKFTAPAAGKTGTTNDYTDAWFIGYTPEITAGVWVGLDDPSLKMGRGGTGSASALPFWADFMKTIYDDLDLPHTQFKLPSAIITHDICNETGDIATTFCPDVLRGEIFNAKFEPSQRCRQHTGGGTSRRGSRVF